MSAVDKAAIRDVNAGRGIGACVLSGFGALWLYNALGLSAAPRWSFALMWAATAALALGGVLCIRAAKTEGGDMRLDRRVARRFWIVFAAEGFGIVGALVLFPILHLDQYVVPAIAAIVGLHFLPLASLFRVPLYYLAGIVMVLWSAAMIIVLPHEIARDAAVAYGTGFILWATALLMLAIPRR